MKDSILFFSLLISCQGKLLGENSWWSLVHWLSQMLLRMTMESHSYLKNINITSSVPWADYMQYKKIADSLLAVILTKYPIL